MHALDDGVGGDPTHAQNRRDTDAERGVYFDSWFKHNHCYHPSLHQRTVQMLEDLKRYRADVLVWAGMGGGSISQD